MKINFLKSTATLFVLVAMLGTSFTSCAQSKKKDSKESEPITIEELNLLKKTLL